MHGIHKKAYIMHAGVICILEFWNTNTEAKGGVAMLYIATNFQTPQKYVEANSIPVCSSAWPLNILFKHNISLRLSDCGIPLSHLSPSQPSSHWHTCFPSESATHVPCTHPGSHTATASRVRSRRYWLCIYSVYTAVLAF